MLILAENKYVSVKAVIAHTGLFFFFILFKRQQLEEEWPQIENKKPNTLKKMNQTDGEVGNYVRGCCI